MNLQRQVDPDNVTEVIRRTFENIISSFKPCKIVTSRPRRFKFTLRENAQFDSTIYVDLFWIGKKIVLHTVDKATRYQAARWIPSMSAKTIWQSLRWCWFNVYIGPPDVIAYDKGRNFFVESFQMNADLFSIHGKAIPVESANSMGIVKCYHDPAWRAYRIIIRIQRMQMMTLHFRWPLKQFSTQLAPMVSVQHLRSAVPYHSLVSDAISHPPLDSPKSNSRKENNAGSHKSFSSWQVWDGLRTSNGPNVTEILPSLIESHALVYLM